MGYFAWANAGIKRMTWVDIAFTKLAVAAFVLLIAKLWPPVLELRWWCYLAVGVLASIRPYGTLLSKGQGEQ